MPMSTFLKDEVLDHTLAVGSYTMPATVYCALYTDDPTGADVGTECDGGGYVRKAMAFDASATGATANTAKVTFPTATDALWGTITHIGLRDALSGGNLLYYQQLTSPKAVGVGDVLVIDAGAVTVTVND